MDPDPGRRRKFMTRSDVRPELRYDALIFDLGKVIVDFDPARAIRNLNAAGNAVAQDRVTELLESGVIRALETGLIGREEFWRRVCALLRIESGRERFYSAWADIFDDRLLLPEAFFDPLGAVYRLFLLSNTDELHMEFLLSRFPFLERFNGRTLSYQVGAMKPDPAIYHAAARLSGARAERIFFVDDLAANVQAAQELGWTAVRYVSRGQLEAEMSRLGVWPLPAGGAQGAIRT